VAVRFCPDPPSALRERRRTVKGTASFRLLSLPSAILRVDNAHPPRPQSAADPQYLRRGARGSSMRLRVEELPLSEVEMLCRRHEVGELALFGPALRDDFGPGSDLDLLVEFRPATRVGLMALARLQRELSSLLGRPVDVVPKGGLYPRRLRTHRSGSSRNFPGRRAADVGQRVFSQTEPKSHRDFGVFLTFAGITHRLVRQCGGGHRSRGPSTPELEAPKPPNASTKTSPAIFMAP